jgi:hypothetical protein
LLFNSLRFLFRSFAIFCMGHDGIQPGSHPGQTKTCSATTFLAYYLLVPFSHAAGTSARISHEAQPCLPLLDHHVRHLDDKLDGRYRWAPTCSECRELALAGYANLTLWLGWLHSLESFGLTNWHNLEATEPAKGLIDDLPMGCGFPHYHLLPERKSSWTPKMLISSNAVGPAVVAGT